MYTVEFNAKDLHPWIQDRLEESGNYSHQGWGEFTLTDGNQQKIQINQVLYAANRLLNSIVFQSRLSLLTSDSLKFNSE